VRHGIFLPIFDALSEPRLLADLAAEAEAAGWDGVFLWDHVYYRDPVQAVGDAWVSLAAMAMTTERVTLGPMVTPLARRRPQVLSRQVAAIDRLSQGRMVLGVGLGLDMSGNELSRFGEETDDRRRASMYDEALDVVRALLSGQPVDHHGEHYTARGTFLPAAPVPIWAGARWPNRRPLRRAATLDGVFLIETAPANLPKALEVIAETRSLDGYEVVVGGGDPREWERAGATWWLASFTPFGTDVDVVRRTIGAGPRR
jgi:alkanesulfonate monooxygenase SsuD/methylene tetrahydromethanopterin reductase-like flavin-dependent oxidoreductase (luciferase family)